MKQRLCKTCGQPAVTYSQNRLCEPHYVLYHREYREKKRRMRAARRYLDVTRLPAFAVTGQERTPDAVARALMASGCRVRWSLKRKRWMIDGVPITNKRLMELAGRAPGARRHGWWEVKPPR